MVHGTTEWLIGSWTGNNNKPTEDELAPQHVRTWFHPQATQPRDIHHGHKSVATIYYTVDECLVCRQCFEIVLLSLVDCDVTWRSRRVEVSAILVTDDVDWFQCEIPMSYWPTVVMGTGSSPIVTNVNMCEGLNTHHQSYTIIAFEDIHCIEWCPACLLRIIKIRMLLSFVQLLLILLLVLLSLLLLLFCLLLLMLLLFLLLLSRFLLTCAEKCT